MSELTTQDIARIRSDFPILQTKVHDKPLIYFDNAASAQKPFSVVNAISNFYTHHYSNVHRSVHKLSEKATELYEESREAVRDFIHAKESREIIFVRGTTEAINLVAQSYGRTFIKAEDEILITEMEHHSNIVPWQILCEQTGAKLKVAPINDEGELILDKFLELLTPKTKFVALTHISNSLGTINPIKQIIKAAHKLHIPVLIDGAQAVPHMPVDVRDLDCDFYVFSGHKLFGPTGIGVLYGKTDLLEKMPPYQSGGEMISRVTFEKTTYNVLPFKFEAGTPNITGSIGLKVALDYIKNIGLERIMQYEKNLLAYLTQQIQTIPDVRLIGTAKNKAAIVSFVMGNIHPHDIGTILDQQGVAIRSGHHCNMPLMQRMQVPATARASLAFYNTKEEIDHFLNALEQVKKVFH